MKSPVQTVLFINDTIFSNNFPMLNVHNSGEYNVRKLISDRDRHVLEIANYVVLISFICVFGLGANCINIIVFYKQGFRNTMNISLCGLAVSDLCSLLTLQWTSVCLNPWFINSGIPISPAEIQYLTGGTPHVCFVRITGCITVYITAERCLCITFPLKIKQIVTPRKTTLTICVIYVTLMFSFFLEYITCYFDWKFYESKNKSLLGLAFRSNRQSMAGFIFFLYSISGFASFISVIVFTVILVVQLQRKSKWRLKANLDATVVETITARDTKTMRMVAMIATILIVCYTPGVAASIFTIIEPELSVVGKYINTFFVVWSFCFLFEAVNSSINIFVYYNMGTKYRETLNQIFSAWKLNSPEQCRQ